MKRIDHPNVVRAEDFFHDVLYNKTHLVMEFADSPSLRDLLKSQKVVSEDLTKMIANGVMKGIQAIHK